MTTPCVLALVGPTASGKSAIGLTVAERLGAEIVAVDAFTVYRGMNVGTAKPTVADRERVPHHLVDVLDPDEDCSVSWFQRAARDAIAGVLSRAAVPLLIGGSGLYFRAVVDPLEFPPTDATVRRRIEERAALDAIAAHRRLLDVDPEAASRIAPENTRRVVRALEVFELTGRPFSDWRRAWDDYRSIYPNLRVVGVDLPRDGLITRIDVRVDEMVAPERGPSLVDECRRLRRGPLSRTARQAIGYREVLDHLDGGCTLEEAVERAKQRSRRYAARQRSWFAADPRVRWQPPSSIPEVLAGLCGS